MVQLLELLAAPVDRYSAPRGGLLLELSSSNASPLLGSSLSKPAVLGDTIQRRPNAGLLVDDIKQEAVDYS
jgi:hypothetical protein